MSGRKLRQLKEAMATILDDLNRGDLFSIVVFSEKVEVWDPALGEAEMQDNLGRLRDWTESTTDAERSGTPAPSVITAITLENTNKAKRFVQNLTTYSATNIHGALMKALQILEVGRSASPEQTNHAEERPEPMIIFLTDGQANVGVSDTFRIVSSVTAANAGNSSIFSLALGNGADFPFLKKLSLRNSGFARKIYEASDTALQLTDFYRQVASPLLANVTFRYQPDQVEPQSVTRLAFRRFFSGSELVVAGRLHGNNVTGEVQAHSSSGSARYPFDPVILPTTPTANTMERLWAYLTIQQLLEDDDASTSPGKQRALELALTYSFVTPLTSLVVVRPDNETRPVEPEEASFAAADRSRAPSHVSPVSLSSFPVQGAAKTSHNAYSRILPGGYQDMRPISSSGAYYADLILPAYPVSTSASLDDILWLSPNDTTVSLPTGVNGTSEVLNLATADETNAAYAACVTPGGQPGHCRHLKYCVLLTFLNNQTEFLPFFCRIDSFVGVCCQDDS
ncbi:Inter-alpha-trypsin inhibitor heavy chain H4 [Zootermopsis nevadensis]|uniref:Inter-alpha-trypsin inhibitor heavy chain H4 n=2 Tax=Zootermopsis nevadensis TaxID=136037 RepID=A0A067QXG8_ZOONE|nr:Inter-alpha-trypsin inhibitor heavy chain H4 [Zootermopsis nevadensis]